ncbi:MAG: VWA domain-containing protein [Thiotrichales bacterium]|nr:VWA domain-containing protein [Thiotrichales bacterium]
MIEIEWPWVFLLLPLPLAVYFLMPAIQSQDSALRVPFFQDVSQLHDGSVVAKSCSLLSLLLLSLVWVLLIIASSRPNYVGQPLQLPSVARDLMLAVDISGSMDETDMQINGRSVRRVDAVKAVVGEFVERRQSDRLGLILFADNAYLQAPLTFDLATVKKLLDEAQLGFAGTKTAIGDAIGLAIKRMIERPAKSRVVVLLTDGENNAGKVEPLEAARLAAEQGITLYTIGIGAGEQVVRSFFGSSIVNPSRDLDEDTLQEIASLTGGKYYRAKNVEELERIYVELDKIEPVAQDAEIFRPRAPLFYWPMALALLLSVVLVVLGRAR